MRRFWMGVCFLLFLGSFTYAAQAAAERLRVFVVSSYHREYLWSQDTQNGMSAGLLEFKFLDDAQQAADYTKNDYVETPALVIKKTWMDSKRKP